MFKSLQDIFKIPPPTTYEIEAGEEAKRTGGMNINMFSKYEY